MHIKKIPYLNDWPKVMTITAIDTALQKYIYTISHSMHLYFCAQAHNSTHYIAPSLSKMRCRGRSGPEHDGVWLGNVGWFQLLLGSLEGLLQLPGPGLGGFSPE